MSRGGIIVENLRVERGSFVLEIPHLEVAPHEVFAILGETGSGKTVLLESIAGAFAFASGSVLVDGCDVAKVPVQQRRLGIVYQDHALFPHMTVEQNVGYGLRVAGVPADEVARRVGEQLELFGIERVARSYPGTISGGESQRAALARALVMEPAILLLDEPFSALDPVTKERMYTMVHDIHDRFDCTIVFVSHDFNEAVALAGRVGVVLGGRLRTVVSADELFSTNHDLDVQRFLGLSC